jgi:hypothetical protein
VILMVYETCSIEGTFTVKVTDLYVSDDWIIGYNTSQNPVKIPKDVFYESFKLVNPNQK